MAEQILLKANDGTHDVYPQWHGTVDGAGNVVEQNPAWSQPATVFLQALTGQAVTASQTRTASTYYVPISGYSDYKTLLVKITGASSTTTIYPEVSDDGTNWFPIQSAGADMALGTTLAPGSYAMNFQCNGDYLRFTYTTGAGGTATITARVSMRKR